MYKTEGFKLAIKKHVIQNINTFLAQCGKTGADMSHALNLSNSAYSNWNKYKANVSNKNLANIAAWLSSEIGRPVTVDELLSENVKEQQKAPTESMLDEREAEFLRLYHMLGESKQRDRVIAYMQGLLSNQ